MQDKAASGFLAVLFPADFGTVDRWAVKLLKHLDKIDFPTMTVSVWEMDPERLTMEEVIEVIQIYREKALELNQRFQSSQWTPRKIDMALFSLQEFYNYK